MSGTQQQVGYQQGNYGSPAYGSSQNYMQNQLTKMPSFTRGQPGPMGASGSKAHIPFDINNTATWQGAIQDAQTPMIPTPNRVPARMNPIHRPGYPNLPSSSFIPGPMGQTQMSGMNTYSAPTTDQVTDAYGNVMPQKVSDPYMTAGGNQTGGRSPMEGSFQTKPMQMPQQFQTGGMTDERIPTGGYSPAPVKQAPMQSAPSYQPQQSPEAAWQAQNAGLLKKQTVMDPAFFGQPQASNVMPPQPQNSQPGQAGSHWGPAPDGSRDTPFSWQPSFMPGQNEYISHMYNTYLNPQQKGQVDWGNALSSIGNLSGMQFDANRWSR